MNASLIVIIIIRTQKYGSITKRSGATYRDSTHTLWQILLTLKTKYTMRKQSALWVSWVLNISEMTKSQN